MPSSDPDQGYCVMRIARKGSVARGKEWMLSTAVLDLRAEGLPCQLSLHPSSQRRQVSVHPDR